MCDFFITGGSNSVEARCPCFFYTPHRSQTHWYSSAFAKPTPSRMATRSRTQLYTRHRDALRTHRKKVVRPPDDKVNRNLLDMRAALSDDEGMGDARVYSIPPVWVVTVQDLKRDVMSIESKSAPSSRPPVLAAITLSPCAVCGCCSQRAERGVRQAPAPGFWRRGGG